MFTKLTQTHPPLLTDNPETTEGKEGVMCHFISWIELNGDIYFLDDTKLNTKEGRKLLKDLPKEDLIGHGAIRQYYPELKDLGKDCECANFSSPKNFPPEIVKAIKKGLFEKFGIASQILVNPAWAEYEKIEGQALAEYKKIEGPAWVEYEKIQGPALAEYEKIQGPALAEYEKIEGQAWVEYEKIQGPIFWKLARIKKNRKKEWK